MHSAAAHRSRPRRLRRLPARTARPALPYILRSLAGRDGLRPAAELGHLRCHKHGADVLRALLPALRSDICSRAALSRVHAACTVCTLHAPRLLAASPLPARSSPRTACPTCDQWQDAAAFDQPLSWDTSGVKIMSRMFQVRPHPRTPSVPHMQSAESLPVPRTLRVHTAGARATPPAFRGLQLAPHRAPCWRPLAGRGGLQPAAELGHLRRHKHGGHVLRAPLTAPA